MTAGIAPPGAVNHLNKAPPPMSHTMDPYAKAFSRESIISAGSFMLTDDMCLFSVDRCKCRQIGS